MRAWLWLCLLLGALAGPVQAQPVGSAEPGASLRISLLTFAPGEVYWQRFGHNAILVEDVETGANAVYNFGMFDFQQKNFFLNFARGHMVYWLDTASLESTLANYAHERRWVYRQVLALDAAQRIAMAEALDRNAQPLHRDYRYDYFRDNCSTRVRDAIDLAFGGGLQKALSAQPAGVSYRFEGTRLIAPIGPLAAGMDLIMGPAGDQPLSVWQQSFVPEVLMQALRSVRVDGRAVVESEDYLIRSDVAPVAPAAPLLLWPWTLAAGSALGLLLAWLAQYRRALLPRLGFATLATVFWLFCGFAGTWMLAAWALTEHWAMAANRNLLLASPLAWLLVPAAWRSARRGWQPTLWQLRLALLIAALAALPLVLALLPHAQQQWSWLALLLPVHLGLAYAMHSRRLATDPNRD